VLALLALTLPVAAEAKRVKAHAELVIVVAVFEDPKQETRFEFGGFVFSSNNKCERRRAVQVLRHEPEGPDTRIASNRTDGTGFFYTRARLVPAEAEGDRYYAKVKQKKKGKLTCRADRSRKLTVEF
jgi:hypothetical protein